MLEEALLILLLVIPLPPNKTFRMAIRIPATVALLWWLLPNGVFFGICAALIFAIGWWLLQRLPLYPFAFRILFGFLFAEQLVPTSLTDGEDKRAGLPDGWSHHLACFSVGLLASTCYDDKGFSRSLNLSGVRRARGYGSWTADVACGLRSCRLLLVES